MSKTNETIHIVGGGLAGSEAALQLASRGYKVHLHEMRQGNIKTPAHKTKLFAELVCSNSMGSLSETSATGQMKWEAQRLGSEVLKSAFEAAVPAGQALGVDRDIFAQSVSSKVLNHPNIIVEKAEVKSLDNLPRPLIVCTGPLTSEHFSQSLQKHFGEDFLYFYDAIAPIIDADSINMDTVWRANRWNKGEGNGDYLNCPMNKEQYFKFIDAVKNARKIEPKSFETTKYFEGCMPIEAALERGDHTLRFGCMTPAGLDNPKTNRWEYAIVQLRQDNKEATAYNMVGFQTKMAYADQKEVFRLIPGLEKADFLKLGSIHRNLYINSLKCLNPDLSSKKDPLLFFAGQITGVEGYFESTCTGLLVSHFIDQKIKQKPFVKPPRQSALGSLLHAITLEEKKHFQPTNINFGLFPQLQEKIKNKLEKREKIISRAKDSFNTIYHQ